MLRKLTHSVLAMVLTSGLYLGALVTSAPVAPVAIVGVVATCALTQTACSKDQLVSAGEDVLSVVTDTALMNALRSISPAALQKLEALVPDAQKLVTALKNGDTTNALALVNTIFPVISEIVSSVNGDPKIAGFLALANIALHFIINHTSNTKPAVAARKLGMPGAQKATDNGAQKIWGCGYDAKNKRQQYQELCHGQ